MKPCLSVIICTRNRPQDISLCLPTVLACVTPGTEVLLVDQSDTDDTGQIVRALAREFPALRHLPTATVGKTRALEIGIREAQGDVLAFTDDDCEVPPDWLERIQQEMAAAPAVDVFFGPVLPSPAIAGKKDICIPSWTFAEARDLFPGEVCGMGANMALRCSVLSRLPAGPLFDPLLGPGAPFPAAEEGDFVYRLRRAGARAALRPSLKVWHRAFRLPAHWQNVLYGYGVGDAAFHLKHARCGDRWAWGAIGRTLARFGTRAAGKALLRRRPNSDWSSLRGYWHGLQVSRARAVDPQTRLYRGPQEETAPSLAKARA